MTAPHMKLELSDIQGNIVRGYRLPHVAHLFGTICPKDLNQWQTALRRLAVTHDAGSSKPKIARNVGISHAGMKLLVPEVAEELNRFEAYAAGMRRRAPLLGDPANVPWQEWEDRHVWIAIHAADAESLGAEVSRLRDNLDKQLTSSTLFGDARVDEHGHWHEPFGFRDDISQPAIAGTHSANRRGGGKWDKQANDWLPIAAGEFLLGYPNESGRNVLERFPKSAPLLKNGTFAVFRELVQDVTQFKDTVAREAARWGITADSLQTKLVGRDACGTPLARVEKPGELADFRYEDDPSGIRCPVGAHVRRCNPRVTGEHRMIRRGMPYCRKGGDPSEQSVEGMYFVAYNASIENQFEFIQSIWLNRSAGTLPDSRDPLVGEGHPGASAPAGTRRMLIEGDAEAQRDPIVLNLPQFVTCRGGEYYFTPGLQGLRRIAGA